MKRLQCNTGDVYSLGEISRTVGPMEEYRYVGVIGISVFFFLNVIYNYSHLAHLNHFFLGGEGRGGGSLVHKGVTWLIDYFSFLKPIACTCIVLCSYVAKLVVRRTLANDARATNRQI